MSFPFTFSSVRIFQSSQSNWMLVRRPGTCIHDAVEDLHSVRCFAHQLQGLLPTKPQKLTDPPSKPYNKAAHAQTFRPLDPNLTQYIARRRHHNSNNGNYKSSLKGNEVNGERGEFKTEAGGVSFKEFPLSL